MTPQCLGRQSPLLGGSRLVREVRERVDDVLPGGLHHRPCHLVGVLQLDAVLQGSVGALAASMISSVNGYRCPISKKSWGSIVQRMLGKPLRSLTWPPCRTAQQSCLI